MPRTGVEVGASIALCCAAVGGLWAAEPPCTGDPVTTAQSLIDADNRRDLPAVMAHYTEEAVLLPPTGEVVEGSETIAARYRRLFAESLVEFEVEVDEAVVGGDTWAYLRGTTKGLLTPVSGGPPRGVASAFLMILRCEEEEWKVHRLSWSEGEPAEAGEGDDGDGRRP